MQADLKDRGIPLRIDGVTRFVKGASKYTTVNDVIKMVLKKTGIGKEYRHLFAIYEVSLVGEKLLPPKDRILKLIASWNDAPNKLILRRVEPLATVQDNNKDKKQKTKLERIRQESTRINPVQKAEDQYMKTLVSLANFVERQKQKFTENVEPHAAPDSSSESDESVDEFLSNLDHSKVTGFVQFFAAMAGGAKSKKARKKNLKETSSESDDADNRVVFRRRRPVRRNRSSLRATKVQEQRHIQRQNMKKTTMDVHPNKMHRIERVNFGFIDVEPSSRDHVYAEPSFDTFNRRLKAHKEKVFTARRRLLSNTSSDECAKSNASECLSDSHHKTLTHVRSNGSCATVNSSLNSTSNCSTLSSSSSDFDNAFMVNDSHLSRTTRRNSDTSMTLVGRVRSLNNKAKLVDYTVTEDELSDVDSDIGSAGSKLSFFSSSSGSSIESCHDSKTTTVKNAHAQDSTNDVTQMSKHIDLDVSDYIRCIFGKKCDLNEDEEMDSFMKSVVADDSISDEGMSSMESDIEKCEQV